MVCEEGNPYSSDHFSALSVEMILRTGGEGGLGAETRSYTARKIKVFNKDLGYS